jgi:hypothetical protein
MYSLPLKAENLRLQPIACENVDLFFRARRVAEGSPLYPKAFPRGRGKFTDFLARLRMPGKELLSGRDKDRGRMLLKEPVKSLLRQFVILCLEMEKSKPVE